MTRTILDLAKPKTAVFDLSTVLNPRVNDDLVKISFHIQYDNKPFNMTGYKMYFISADENMGYINIDGMIDKIETGDNVGNGDVTFRFPPNVFKKAGTFDSTKTMFVIENVNSNYIQSTINISLTVLENGIAKFNADVDQIGYDSKLEEIHNKYKEKAQNLIDELINQVKAVDNFSDVKESAEQAKQVANDSIAKANAVKNEVITARSRFSNLNDRLNNQDIKINAAETTTNANANYNRLDEKDLSQDKIISTKADKDEIERKLSQISLVPEAFDNVEALKSKYPNGKTGIFITVDTGHKWIYSNQAWVDGGVYQAAGIPREAFGSGKKIIDGENGILKDFNSIPIEMANRAIAIGNNIRAIKNIPIDFDDKENSGLFIDLRSIDGDNTTGSIQFIFDTKNRGWYRIGWFKQNQYTNWNSIYNDEFLENTTVKSYVLTGKNGFKFSTVGLKKLTDEEFNQFVDLDFLPKKNLSAVYTSNILGENKLKNVPKEGGFNLVQTNANFINDSYTGTVQTLTYPDGERFYRICWYSENNWTDWEEIVTKSDINLNNISNTVLPAFESVAVIGDSYASGTIYSSDGTNHKGDQYNKSWLAALSRKYGFEYYNYSVGGQTTWGWLSASTRGLDQLKSDSVKELYIINLGINDANKRFNELGTSEDIATKKSTFYGNLSRIYDEIRAKAPNSVIVFATIAVNGIDSKQYDDFSKAIEEVALSKNAPCLNLRNNKMLRPISETMVGGHPTALGYVQLGNVIDLELSKVITIDKYKQIFS